MKPGIDISNLTKEFGNTRAVDSLNISVPAGSFLVLLGPSGCGKTTTLRMLAGLEEVTSGTISFGDQLIADGSRNFSIPSDKRGCGLVFQSYALWPHMTVEENVSWPLKIAGLDKTSITERTADALAMMGISELASRYPAEISGGQQQRVAIARMIAPQPEVLLFDEPLSNLDAKLRVEMRGELMKVHRATKATSVYVTHDQVEAMTMATHIALLKDGKLEQFGTPDDLLNNPATEFVATFMGTPPANVLRHSAFAGSGIAPRFPIDGSIMYRADSLSLASEPGASTLTASFIDQAPMVGRFVVGAELPDGQRLNVVSDTCFEGVVGDPVHVVIPAQPDALFAADATRAD